MGVVKRWGSLVSIKMDLGGVLFNVGDDYCGGDSVMRDICFDDDVY